MEALNIPATVDTPEVKFDPGNGTFEISGKSYPEDTAEVYMPVLEWLDNYVKEPSTATTLSFRLDYFNSSSYKSILNILMKLEAILEQEKGLKVIWFYKERDIDMLDAGEEFSELVEVPFEFEVRD